MNLSRNFQTNYTICFLLVSENPSRHPSDTSNVTPKKIFFSQTKQGLRTKQKSTFNLECTFYWKRKTLLLYRYNSKQLEKIMFHTSRLHKPEFPSDNRKQVCLAHVHHQDTEHSTQMHG